MLPRAVENSAAALSAVRIVRRTVARIRHAVAVAVAAVPAATLELPAVAVLGPDRCGPVVALAVALPVSGLPHVALAVRVPIPRRPGVAAASGGNPLEAGSGRRGVEEDLDRGTGGEGHRHGPERSRAHHGDHGLAKFHGSPFQVDSG